MCAAVVGVVATGATARTSSVITLTTGPTPPIRTALFDPLFQGPQQTTAFAMASDAGATYVRLTASWASIAPVSLPPSGFDPTDPASSYYRWTAMDAAVAGAVAAGLTPFLDIAAPPAWGYSVQPKPALAQGGTPKIDALGAFASALAARYNGSGPAPAVRAYAVWNEPNFNRNLYPQSPVTYRSMVNAVADSVHAVNAANLVVAGELAPFKHVPVGADKNSVTPPLGFMKSMLCVSGGPQPQRTCSATAKFDVWSHHPYTSGNPFAKALVGGGVQLGDLPAMKKLLDDAESLGAIDSAHPPQFWVTEVGWASKPPKLGAVPMKLLSRWMSETMYQVWTSGANLATWFVLQDFASGPFQSGVYFYSPALGNAVAKPILTPFRFPFVAYFKTGGNVLVWGRNATSDQRAVEIQRQALGQGAWHTVAVITSNSNGIFRATLALGAGKKDWIRAVAPGSGTSLAFALTPPANENAHIAPWGG